MKNISKALLALILLSGLNGCAYPRASAGPGWIFTDTKEAQFIDNSIKGSKKGEACGENILGIISTGDSTIETAKRNGGINNVNTADRTYWGVLGIYSKSCLIVKGN
jgi:TRL-like protein family